MSQTTTLNVLLFAGLKQAAKTHTLAVEVQRDATVEDLLNTLSAAHPYLAAALSQCRVAVDQEFVAADHPLVGATEIALIPPVSGGTNVDFLVRAEPLSLAEVVACVEHPGAGGLVTFTGNVRRHSRGKTIVQLEYEAYVPMAVSRMRSLAEEIHGAVEGSRVAIHHRIGTLTVGETAVVIAASAPHRAQAFDACRRAIEALKESVPIWKRELSEDGEAWWGQGP
ncbi:MAG: molybdopterin converting factor subunit 1 [Nannocystaceae bacterium]|nr:molybdopterin converting factor subunit 1 [Nannocystaceae bacterium]